MYLSKSGYSIIELLVVMSLVFVILGTAVYLSPIIKLETKIYLTYTELLKAKKRIQHRLKRNNHYSDSNLNTALALKYKLIERYNAFGGITTLHEARGIEYEYNQYFKIGTTLVPLPACKKIAQNTFEFFEGIEINGEKIKSKWVNRADLINESCNKEANIMSFIAH